MNTTDEYLQTLRTFAQDTGPFRCTKGQATELAVALQAALKDLDTLRVLIAEKEAQ